MKGVAMLYLALIMVAQLVVAPPASAAARGLLTAKAKSRGLTSIPFNDQIT